MRKRLASQSFFTGVRAFTSAAQSTLRESPFRINALTDQLFPSFLNGSKSALTPFCDASLELMKERFSAPEIARRKVTSLANLLRRYRVIA